MKWLFGNTAIWLWMTIATGAAAFAVGQDASLPAGDGKKILEDSCTACHDLEAVKRQRLNKEGWQNMITSMISNGAQVDQKDLPVLVDYLAKNFGADQPAAGTQPKTASAGDGKTILEANCTGCHDTDLVTSQKNTKEGWQDIVNSMVSKGATISAQEMPVLIDYLTQNYGPKE